MTSIAIIAVAFFCLIAFVVAVQAAREIELAKLGAACPCRDLHSIRLEPGSVYELPAGMKLHSETVDTDDECDGHTKSKRDDEPDDEPEDLDGLKEQIDAALHEASWETVDAYEDIRDRLDTLKAQRMMASGSIGRRLRGEDLLLKVLKRRADRGAGPLEG